MSDIEVVFRTRSEIEASVVQGLLESQGLHVIRVSGPPSNVFAFSVSTLGDIHVAVPVEEAAEARRALQSHGDAGSAGLSVPLASQLGAVEQRLGYVFRDRGHLEHALTHKSRAAEDPSGGVVDNESLEFLGDAVLGLIVADVLYRQFPLEDEGRKSKMKAALVSEVSLASIAERLGLGEHLRLGRGEDKSGGRRKAAVIADACEAVIAAIYLDGGFEAARSFVEREWLPAVDAARATGHVTSLTGDFKSALQERLQAANAPPPEYRLVSTDGPDHRKTFAIELWSEGKLLASADGRSKKEAEQRAAKAALDAFDVN